MNIEEIYKKYNIPPNLQRHMKMVVALAGKIADNWQGGNIDTGVLNEACLLHDMGNIIKFDFDDFPELLGDEAANIDYWRRVKQEMIDRYGADEDIATLKICKELAVGDRVMFIIENWGFGNFDRIAESDDWEWKIAVYADHRVGPFGIVTLQENLDNKRKRYKLNRPNASHVSDDFERLFAAALEVERQIGEKVGVDIAQIAHSVV